MNREPALRRVSGAIEPRHDLVAAIAFLESPVERLSELLAWFDLHVVARGIGPRPSGIAEAPVGVVALDGDGTGDGGLLALAVDAAKTRVRDHLRALVRAPGDDRFVTKALFRGWVTRVATPEGPAWRASPPASAMLSEVVLSFFAADILAHRDDYDRALSICDECGRVSFVRDAADRHLCFEHGQGRDLPSRSGTYARG